MEQVEGPLLAVTAARRRRRCSECAVCHGRRCCMLHCVLQVDPEFKAELRRLRREFIGGPTPIYHARHAPGDL